MTQNDLDSELEQDRAHKAEPTVSIVIPAKNEALNLPHVFSALDVEATR